jgi:3-oxoacyl-[acyl-carrier-protein] synthase II
MTASSRRRVVFTGLGFLSPLGGDTASTWTALRAGQSAIRAIRSFDVSPLPCRIGGEMVGFDAKKYISDRKKHKSLRMMARTIQLAVAGAEMALTDAGFKPGELDPTRFGVEFGSSMIPTELEDLAPASKVCVNCQPGSVSLTAWGEKGIPEIPPLWMLKYLPNMPACHVSILYDAQGPNNSITESEAASLLAVGEAYRILQRDGADFFLVGGADSKISPLSLARQSLVLPLTRRNDEPEKAVRPFDRGRDGTALSEGAAVFGLEDLDHARRRNARILGELVGFASAFDRQRSGTGLARAIRAALAEAAVGPEAIDHVSAHGTGSPVGDAWEARGIHEVFGHLRPAVPVWAAKSALGHMGPAGGGAELAASVLALRDGVVPPTLNYEQPDPACPVHVVAGEPRPVARPYALKVSFTDLGQCAAAVVKRWEGS